MQNMAHSRWAGGLSDGEWNREDGGGGYERTVGGVSRNHRERSLDRPNVILKRRMGRGCSSIDSQMKTNLIRVWSIWGADESGKREVGGSGVMVERKAMEGRQSQLSGVVYGKALVVHRIETKRG